MKIYKVKSGIVIEKENSFYLVKNENWDQFINDDNLFKKLNKITAENAPAENAQSLIKNELEAPVQSQEIWASGVTYFNSKLGREEESKKTGGGQYYANVYVADRPELFFKATAHRTVGSGGQVAIRKDSTWDVPEPELTLVITSSGKIVGYTVGNDMSSRSIEGENPLYLPQAKTYDACASVGPGILVMEGDFPEDSGIHLNILRNGKKVFEGNTTVSQMKRKPKELVSYLYRECTFPHGSFLMTGTGIVPTNEFTLQKGDEIQITIDHIGTLINTVK